MIFPFIDRIWRASFHSLNKDRIEVERSSFFLLLLLCLDIQLNNNSIATDRVFAYIAAFLRISYLPRSIFRLCCGRRRFKSALCVIPRKNYTARDLTCNINSKKEREKRRRIKISKRKFFVFFSRKRSSRKRYERKWKRKGARCAKRRRERERDRVEAVASGELHMVRSITCPSDVPTIFNRRTSNGCNGSFERRADHLSPAGYALTKLKSADRESGRTFLTIAGISTAFPPVPFFPICFVNF